MVAVIVWHESGGDPLAYSVAGAVGLMQVMASDGISGDDECENGLCYADRPTVEELKDPETNIRTGTKLLAQWIQDYGSLRDALKQYGPSKVGFAYADTILSAYKEVAP